jgi:hypothetical protein
MSGRGSIPSVSGSRHSQGITAQSARVGLSRSLIASIHTRTLVCDEGSGTPSWSRIVMRGAKFNDMQMYVVTYFDKVVMVGSAIDLPVPRRRGHSRLAASACARPRQPAQHRPQRARGDRAELTSSSAC